MRFLSATGFLTNHPQSLYLRHSKENFQSGGWGGNRTPDTRIFSPLLCQLSYPAVLGEGKGLRKESGLTSGMVENVRGHSRAAERDCELDLKEPGQARRVFRVSPGRFC